MTFSLNFFITFCEILTFFFFFGTFFFLLYQLMLSRLIRFFVFVFNSYDSDTMNLIKSVLTESGLTSPALTCPGEPGMTFVWPAGSVNSARRRAEPGPSWTLISWWSMVELLYSHCGRKGGTSRKRTVQWLNQATGRQRTHTHTHS